MKIYLLDSDVMISYLRGLEETVIVIDHLLKIGSVLGCCPVNITEVYAGMKESERNKTEKFVNSLRFFAIDREVAKLAGNIIYEYRNKGIVLSSTDAMIAAVAINNGLILITYSKRHYLMNELKSMSPKEMET